MKLCNICGEVVEKPCIRDQVPAEEISQCAREARGFVDSGEPPVLRPEVAARAAQHTVYHDLTV